VHRVKSLPLEGLQKTARTQMTMHNIQAENRTRDVTLTKQVCCTCSLRVQRTCMFLFILQNANVYRANEGKAPRILDLERE
jgi:hypothetical protein